MRMRIKTPSGQNNTVEFGKEATVADLCTKITELSELVLFNVKSGYPLKPMDLEWEPRPRLLTEVPFALDGQQLVVFPSELLEEAGQQQDQQKQPHLEDLSLSRRKNDGVTQDDAPSVPVPAYGGNLILRVMPSDNSCLFRALSYCLFGTTEDDLATNLRNSVAEVIENDKSGKYSDAILGMPRAQYCRLIREKNSWGGHIDNDIISRLEGVQIISINVEDSKPYCYPDDPLPDTEKRCYIVYSGIHYDALALSSESSSSINSDSDVTQFDIDDAHILQAALELVGELKKRKYFTNTAKFKIQCEVCGWTGVGEVSARNHGNETGHSQFTQAEAS